MPSDLSTRHHPVIICTNEFERLAGSGKTLAYLLPLVQALREEEQTLCDSITMRNAPRLIILAPTTELCAQVAL